MGERAASGDSPEAATCPLRGAGAAPVGAGQGGFRATAGTLFEVELGTYEPYLPDDQTLASLAAPIRLLVSEHGLPVFAQIAERLGVNVATSPGRHDTYHEYPAELAETMRPFLRQVSEAKT